MREQGSLKGGGGKHKGNLYSLRPNSQKFGPSNIVHKLNLTDSLVISHHD